MKIKTERNVSSLEDIRILKLRLKKKLAQQEELLNEKLDEVKQISTPQNIYNEFLGSFNLENSVFTLLPLALKYKDKIADKITEYTGKHKNMVIAGSAIAAIVGYMIYLKKSKKEVDTQE